MKERFEQAIFRMVAAVVVLAVLYGSVRSCEPVREQEDERGMVAIVTDTIYDTVRVKRPVLVGDTVIRYEVARLKKSSNSFQNSKDWKEFLRTGTEIGRLERNLEEDGTRIGKESSYSYAHENDDLCALGTVYAHENGDLCALDTGYVPENAYSGTYCVNELDSADVEIPISQGVYEGEGYRAWVSGYRASLDSIHLYGKEVVRTETVTIRKKPPRIGVNVGVGYGLTVHGRAEPYVGVTVGYRIF